MFEIKQWGSGKNCKMSVLVLNISKRAAFSREINEKYGEGGGLNANYQQVEALMVIANALGNDNGFKYGKEFIFKTINVGEIILEFDFPENREAAERTMQRLVTAGRIPLNIQTTAEKIAGDAYNKNHGITDYNGENCLLCDGMMQLEMYDLTSYYQCKKDPTHRMSLPEFSDLVHKKRTKEQIVAAIKERQEILAAQLAEEKI